MKSEHLVLTIRNMYIEQSSDRLQDLMKNQGKAGLSLEISFESNQEM